MDNNKIYIHFESEHFEKEMFTKIINLKEISMLNKPMGGLWSSPEDSENRWDIWCHAVGYSHRNNYWNKKFRFILKENANILKVTGDMYINLPHTQIELKYPLINIIPEKYKQPLYELDYEKLSSMYDGIEVNFSDNPELLSYFDFWDCDTLLVFNPNVIQEL